MSSHVSLLPASTPRSAFGKLLGAEAKYQWRVPVGLIFGIGLPALLVVMFGIIPQRQHARQVAGRSDGLQRLLSGHAHARADRSGPHQPAHAPG